MGEKKKLVVISLMEGLPWGGSEELWFKTAVYALKSEVNVYVFLKKWPEDHENVNYLKKLGARIFFLPNSSLPKLNFFQKIFQKKSFSFDQKIKNLKLSYSDMVLINQGDTFSAFNSPIFRQIMHFNKSVCLISQHLSDNETINENLKNQANEYLCRINKFCFVSKRSLELTKKLLSSNGANFHLVNNPVKLKEKKVVKYPVSETPSFAVVARLDCKYKGQDLLLQVLSQDKWKLRDWECKLYGTGKDRNYLNNLIIKYDLIKKVKLKGYCDSVEKIWSENHIMISPSISEGTPLSLVEAHLCGRAAIANDVGGISEVLIDGVTGWLAASPSIKNIDIAMERAWENKDNWKKVGEEAFEYTLKRYSVDAGEELYDLIFNE
jgi:glycosyltransferase involved in cell wall biosynthesis